jgi:predicted anti-sigma-YlaC factor YlaD
MFICDVARRHMSDDLDDALPWHTRAFVRVHLAVCRPCQRVRRQLKDTVTLLRELKDEPVADEEP